MFESRGYPSDGAGPHLPRWSATEVAEKPAPVSSAGLATLPPPASPKFVRDYALSALGITVAQLRALEVEDVDVEAGTLRLTGRRGRGKLVMISGQSVTGLRRWLAVRRLLGAHDPAVFISLH